MYWFKAALIVGIYCTISIGADNFKKCGRVEYACKDASCSLTDASYRGGYICDEFPFYAGGFPKFSVNIVSGECKSYADGMPYLCVEWETIEDDEEIKTPSSYDGEDYNSCTCSGVNGNYCSNWLCFIGDTSADNNEYTNCTCTAGSENGNYCSQWNCQEFENGKFEDITNYYCTSDLPAGGNYCWSWEGNSADDEDFEVQSCKCLGVDCQKWYCYKKEMHYWHSLFCLSVGLFGTIGLLIPLCRVSKLYCRKWCANRCCSYNNNRCSSNNENAANQTVTVNSEGNEIYSNIPKNDAITNDGTNKVECHQQSPCKYSGNRCSYGYGGNCNNTTNSGNNGSQCCYSKYGCCCSGKCYFLLLFGTITTGGVGALIVNLCMWLFGFLLSAYLLRKYYCRYVYGNGRCNNGNNGGASNCRIKKCCSSNKDNACKSNCEMKRCGSNSGSNGDVNYEALTKTDV